MCAFWAVVIKKKRLERIRNKKASGPSWDANSVHTRRGLLAAASLSVTLSTVLGLGGFLGVILMDDIMEGDFTSPRAVLPDCPWCQEWLAQVPSFFRFPEWNNLRRRHRAEHCHSLVMGHTPVQSDSWVTLVCIVGLHSDPLPNKLYFSILLGF